MGNGWYTHVIHTYINGWYTHGIHMYKWVVYTRNESSDWGFITTEVLHLMYIHVYVTCINAWYRCLWLGIHFNVAYTRNVHTYVRYMHACISMLEDTQVAKQTLEGYLLRISKTRRIFRRDPKKQPKKTCSSAGPMCCCNMKVVHSLAAERYRMGKRRPVRWILRFMSCLHFLQM